MKSLSTLCKWPFQPSKDFKVMFCLSVGRILIAWFNCKWDISNYIANPINVFVRSCRQAMPLHAELH